MYSGISLLSCIRQTEAGGSQIEGQPELPQWDHEQKATSSVISRITVKRAMTIKKVSLYKWLATFAVIHVVLRLFMSVVATWGKSENTTVLAIPLLCESLCGVAAARFFPRFIQCLYDGSLMLAMVSVFTTQNMANSQPKHGVSLSGIY